MKGLRISRAQPEDLPEILRIENASFSEPWNSAVFESYFKIQGVTITVAETEIGIVGFAVMTQVLDEGHILNIASAPEMRRHGIGRALLCDLCERAVTNGMLYLYLEVREGNTAARRMYESQGFISVGRRRAYYTKPCEDAVLMTKFWFG